MGVYRFGEFELNEESRGLRLRERELDVQPRVFDFLAMLLRHQDRALSKAELLDALWPDVTVTEASLQRVASLTRSLLRAGGMEGAIRNLPRFGYRISIEPPDTSPVAAVPAKPPQIIPAKDESKVLAARAAASERKWQEACAAFSAADASDELASADLEEWALALECCGRPSEGVSPLTRAVAAYSMAGQRLRAAHPALALSRIHLERGELAVANGWHKRAQALIGTSDRTREHGLWCWMGGRIAAAEGDTERALALSEQAYAIGKALEDPVVESLGLIYRGFFRLCLGETAAGLQDQDAAAALGLSSDIDPVVGGILYCNILWACRNFSDWTRANQWTLGYERWCDECGLQDMSGSCRLHRAEVLGVQGTLMEAHDKVRRALDQLALDAPWARGDALRVLGDIHLARGDLAEAEAAYRESHAVGWDPQPGFALLQLELGETEAAYSSLERSLLASGWPSQQRRGVVMATLAKVSAKTGRVERARQLIAELETQPGRWPMPSIRAVAAEAKAELLMAEGHLPGAVLEMQRACLLWGESGCAINSTDVRLSLAALLIQSGDIAGAQLELGTAHATAAKIDSPRLIARSRKLAADLPGAKQASA